MKKATSQKLSPSNTHARFAPSHGEIATQAEALWRKKGCPYGQDDEIWLEAEWQLLAGGDQRPSFNSDAVMAELDGRFPESAGRATTSL